MCMTLISGSKHESVVENIRHKQGIVFMLVLPNGLIDYTSPEVSIYCFEKKKKKYRYSFPCSS